MGEGVARWHTLSRRVEDAEELGPPRDPAPPPPLGGEGLDSSPLPERHERPGHEGDAPTPSLRAARCDSSTGASDCTFTARRALHKLRAANARDQHRMAAVICTTLKEPRGQSTHGSNGRTCASRALYHRCTNI